MCIKFRLISGNKTNKLKLKVFQGSNNFRNPRASYILKNCKVDPEIYERIRCISALVLERLVLKVFEFSQQFKFTCQPIGAAWHWNIQTLFFTLKQKNLCICLLTEAAAFPKTCSPLILVTNSKRNNWCFNTALFQIKQIYRFLFNSVDFSNSFIQIRWAIAINCFRKTILRTGKQTKLQEQQNLGKNASCDRMGKWQELAQVQHRVEAELRNAGKINSASLPKKSKTSKAKWNFPKPSKRISTAREKLKAARLFKKIIFAIFAGLQCFFDCEEVEEVHQKTNQFKFGLFIWKPYQT